MGSASGCRDLWWRKGHTGSDGQEKTVGEQGPRGVSPQNQNRRRGREAIWDSLVSSERGKTREMHGRVGGGEKIIGMFRTWLSGLNLTGASRENVNPNGENNTTNTI